VDRHSCRLGGLLWACMLCVPAWSACLDKNLGYDSVMSIPLWRAHGWQGLNNWLGTCLELLEYVKYTVASLMEQTPDLFKRHSVLTPTPIGQMKHSTALQTSVHLYECTG
jgi:hypothetical protein